MLGQLVPCGGGRPITLVQPKLLVGRQSFCDIPLGFATISSRHCELEFREGYWHVRDLGSKNGTRVNGKLCEAQRLLPNDILAIAGYRYTVSYTPPAGAPSPERAESPGAEPGAPSPAGEVSAPAAEKPAPRRVQERPAGGPPVGQLVPCGGGDPIPLHQAKLVIGRHAACEVVLPMATVSARHCQLEWTDQGWFVRDLGSRNGIRVDGIRCDEKLLSPGSILSIAGLRYQVVYATQETGPRPGAKARLFAQSLLEAAGLVPWRSEQSAAGKRNQSEEEKDVRARWSLDDPAGS